MPTKANIEQRPNILNYVMNNLYKNIVPLHARMYAKGLLGNREEPISKDFISEDEEQKIIKLLEDKYRGKIPRKGNFRYEDYKLDEGQNAYTTFPKMVNSEDYPIRQGLAGFDFEKKNGEIQIKDSYKFYNRFRQPEVDRFARIRKKEGELANAIEVAKTIGKIGLDNIQNNIQNVIDEPNYKDKLLKAMKGFETTIYDLIQTPVNVIGNSYIGRDATPIRINIPYKK